MFEKEFEFDSQSNVGSNHQGILIHFIPSPSECLSHSNSLSQSSRNILIFRGFFVVVLFIYLFIFHLFYLFILIYLFFGGGGGGGWG